MAMADFDHRGRSRVWITRFVAWSMLCTVAAIALYSTTLANPTELSIQPYTVHYGDNNHYQWDLDKQDAAVAVNADQRVGELEKDLEEAQDQLTLDRQGPYGAFGFHAGFHWGYSHRKGITPPEKWGIIPGYETCGTGLEQSPIDIDPVTAKYNEGLEALRWTYYTYGDDPPVPEVEFSGHSIQVDGLSAQLLFKDGWYHFQNFHFHTRSETKINGKDFPLEMHMVHYDKKGRLLILAWLFDTSVAPEPFMKDLSKHLPKAPGDTRTPPDQEEFKEFLNGLLEAHDATKYYSFDGSLTIPPCTEGVRWVVMAEPLGISRKMARKFKHLQHNNRRPIQPLNNRVVEQSWP
mmetsp:Transcript_24396/g.57686  ORF Transcript_24396/g.57686 Transcript_24396/m.57686 type:complete len:349 (-) Transcript_24396:23-1069(-)